MDTEKLLVELERDEGLRLRPYECTAGRLTIGVGRNLDDVGITREEAMILLAHDVRRSIADCELFPWYHKLNGVRQRAICNMMFNLGLARFRGFKKLMAAIRAEDWEEAAVQMLDSKWAEQVGDRANRLAAMMRFGK